MLKEEAEAIIDVPLDEVWDWVKNLENITSIIPRVEIIEKIEENHLIVRGDVLPFLNLPDEITTGEAKTIEVNEGKKHTRTITEGKIYKIETFLQCEEREENETRIFMKAEGELKGKAGTALEKLVFLPVTETLVPSARINDILQELKENIKEYMRKHWKEELEKKTKELESFVYTVSHDLRTPLISLEGFADILSEEYGEELGEEGKHYLERIRANVDKIDNFIDDLLQLSRVGRKEPPKEDVDLEEVAQEVADDLSTELEEKEIEVKIGNNLPSFYFERKRVYQIFSNFISNACKYMGDQENPQIRIDGKDKDGSWLVWVEDNGIGIAEDQQEKIFEVFQRENRVEEEGTGVGLSITKKIVESHDGEIWVESEKGKGSTFYIEFPKSTVKNLEDEKED